MILAALSSLAGLIAAGVVYEELSRRRDAREFPPPGALIDAGGHRLHLLSKGTGAFTVVIEPGAGGPSLSWLGIQDEVCKFARVCIYDRAGYGWSEEVTGPRSLQDRVEDLHTMLANANVPAPYILVSHSYGGFLVRLFARNYPGSVSGLVLVDAPHESGYCQPEVLSLYSKFSMMMRLLSLLARVGLPRVITRVLVKPDPNLTREMSHQINSSMVRREYFSTASDDVNSVHRATEWLTTTGELASLGDIPVVILTHGQPFPGPFAVLEKTWMDQQERLLALSANSLLVTANKSNHMIQNDEPELIVQAIRNVAAFATAGQWPDQGSRSLFQEDLPLSGPARLSL